MPGKNCWNIERVRKHPAKKGTRSARKVGKFCSARLCVTAVFQKRKGDTAGRVRAH